jgi:hypothetical protein
VHPAHQVGRVDALLGEQPLALAQQHADLGDRPAYPLRVQPAGHAADVRQAGQRRQRAAAEVDADANLNKVGTNRPDIQASLDGQRVHFEYDRPPGDRVDRHVDDILNNDPSSVAITVPKK